MARQDLLIQRIHSIYPYCVIKRLKQSKHCVFRLIRDQKARSFSLRYLPFFRSGKVVNNRKTPVNQYCDENELRKFGQVGAGH